MPKIKSHRGAAKRFLRTGSGFKRKSAHRNHILTKKSTKRKRHLRVHSPIKDCDLRSIATMLNKTIQIKEETTCQE